MENIYQTFWKAISTSSVSQIERYKQRHAPEYILKFIELGGGQKLGVTCENFARHKFTCLAKRNSGKDQTGYDHILKIGNKELFVEQKTSTQWSNNDYKWQHVEEKHKWNILLLCGIDYTDVKFWLMNRKTFEQLVKENKITNQGNKEKDSSEGYWFHYSAVKDSLVEVESDEDFIKFAKMI